VQDLESRRKLEDLESRNMGLEIGNENAIRMGRRPKAARCSPKYHGCRECDMLESKSNGDQAQYVHH
jgi:hypothetical protein